MQVGEEMNEDARKAGVKAPLGRKHLQVIDAFADGWPWQTREVLLRLATALTCLEKTWKSLSSSLSFKVKFKFKIESPVGVRCKMCRHR